MNKKILTKPEELPPAAKEVKYPEPGKLYGRKCARVSEVFRMLDDNEAVRPYDIIWVNSSKHVLPFNLAPNFSTLITGSGDCYQIGDKLAKSCPCIASEVIDKIIAYSRPSIEHAVVNYGASIKLRKYSIWRQKIKLEKREWQTEQPPIP